MRQQLNWIATYVLAVGVCTTPALASAEETPILDHTTVGDWQVTWSAEKTKAVNVKTRAEAHYGPMVSLVGPVLSYVDAYFSEGGAHPSSGCSLQSVRLGDEPVRGKVTDLFAEQTVLTALIHAWPVMDELRASRGAPRTLSELATLLGSSCTANWEEDLPSSFAVMGRRGHTAIVRFGLGHGCEAARGTNTQFDVLMDIPPEREAWFEKAANGSVVGVAETCGGTHEWRCCLEWAK